MKILQRIFILALCLLSLSCHKQEEWKNNAQGNFDALWTIINEHYCFFEYKHLDWNAVGEKYRAKVLPNMTNTELFDLCAEMLKELQDGHVNLISGYDVSRYYIWEQYPLNYYERIIDENYLHFDYHKSSGIKYQILSNNIGYMRYGSFSTNIGEGNLDNILYLLSTADGLIIDVRSNGGGYLANVETLVGRFINDEINAGAVAHKTGPGANDFSEPFAYTIKPAPTSRIHFQKPVVVLANRGSFSATNNFVSIMKSLPNVRIVGDTTGDGSGLPFTADLPNGWTVRFSACSITDAQGRITEFGVEPSPNCKVDITDADLAAGKDAILEHAFTVIQQMQ